MKKAVLCVMLLVLVGCEREIPNPASYPPWPVLPAAPLNLSISVGDRALMLTWQMTDVTGIARYRIYRRDGLDTTLVLIDSTTALSYADSGLHNGLRYGYRVSAVDAQGREGRHSALVSAVPNLFGVIINNGEPITTSRLVTLGMVGPAGVQSMRIANTSDFSGSSWEAFAGVRQWLLSAGPGMKSVYVMFRDSDGNFTAGYVTDEILLETPAYQYAIEVNEGAVFAYSRQVRLSITAPSGTGFMKISTNPAFVGATWESFSSSKTWTVTPQEGANGDTLIFYARFRDSNHDSIAVEASDSIVLAFADPVVLLPVYQAPDHYRAITLHWTRSLSADFRSYRIYRSRTPSQVDTLIASYSDAATVTHTDSLNLGSLPSSTPVDICYLVRFQSVFGDSSDSNVLTVRLVNAMPPQVTCYVTGIRYDRDTSGVVSLHATVGWSRSDISDFSHYVVYEHTSPDTTSARPIAYHYDRATLSHDVVKIDVDTLTTYYYWVRVFDYGGQPSGYSQPDSIWYR